MGQELRCPRCDELMVAALIGEVELDFCDPCGVWLDAGEISILAASRGSGEIVVEPTGEPPTKPGRDHPFCPRCDSPMGPARAVGGPPGSEEVALDACPEGHGAWFDQGELERVLGAPLQPNGGA